MMPPNMADMMKPQINQGNMLVGNGFSWQRSNGSSTLTINPSVQYFAWENIAVGGQVTLNRTAGTTFFGVGPQATWFFWNRDMMAAHATTGIGYVSGGGVSSTTLNVGAVFDYFFTPFVSFGPEFNYTAGLSDTTADTVSFVGQFSIYL